ncbi:MAG: 3-oxoacyl-[acyl-carrier-protein] synthase III C-terminal domain-containing protein [Myxococcota bacterium]
MTGITAYGAYVPRTRLPLALIAGRTPREGGAEKAVAYADEDAVTMGVAAAVDCLRGLDRACIDGLLFASTTYRLREKQGAALIARALDLRRDVLTQDHSGSLRAGTTALRAAIDSVNAGSARHVLVIASDCRMGAPRGPLDRNLGDGAAAFLVGRDDAIATLEGAHSISNELQDLWRIEGDRFTHSWEERFVIQEGYLPNLTEAVGGLLDKLGLGPDDFARAALYAPDARSHATVVRELGLAAERVCDPLFGRLGNAGVAFAPLLLAAALEAARAGERILLASYGDGAEALAFRVSERIEKLEPRPGVAGHLARRRPLRSYEIYLRSRGLEPNEWPAAPGPGLSATVRYRERDTDVAFRGGRCLGCGQGHFPQPRVCYRCHSRDRWEPLRLSDRRGRVLAYTFDYFFPSPEPPTIMTVVEVEGCRVHIQLADIAPDDVRLELPVEFMFRKIHDAGGKPNYFWKAVPAAEGDSA